MIGFKPPDDTQLKLKKQNYGIDISIIDLAEKEQKKDLGIQDLEFRLR